MGELVAERVDEARVFERSSRGDVPKSDADRSVREADSVTTFDVRAFGLECPVAKTEAPTERERVALETREQITFDRLIQSGAPGWQSRDRSGLRQRLVAGLSSSR